MKNPKANSTSASPPFLKWTGGKRWLAPAVAQLVPRNYGRYIEPFVGGGAIFFHLRPWPATLSDINPDLINVYRQVRDNVEAVISRLQRLKIDRNFYGTMRASKPQTPITRAVRFLYLNRTAFNGIYRVNRQGLFNVPFGCKPGTVVCDPELLRSASIALQNRKISTSDFERAIDAADEGDLIYADPPYTTKHDNNGFRRYNEEIFSWEDQIRLAKSCRQAVARGAYVIVSNANHGPIVDLYKGFRCKRISRQSLISGVAHGRCSVKECILFR